MAVLVEAISVIVRMDAIEQRYPGGWDAFRDAVPNKTFCCDTHLVRVGFMTPSDVESYVGKLESNGLVYIDSGESVDIAVADQQRGFAIKCNWAQCFSVMIDDYSVMACQAVGDDSQILMYPDHWQYEGSLSHTYSFVPTEHMEKSTVFLRHVDNMDVYLNTLTGKEVYVGRTGKEKE